MSVSLPAQAREAVAVGHAVLITTNTGRFLLPANLVTTTWQTRFAHDPTAVITTTGVFGDFFTPAQELPTVAEQTRAQLGLGAGTRMVLNIAARMISHYFSPKLSR